MNIEYEAKYQNIDKEDIRSRLVKVGTKLVRPEFLQKRTVFGLPKENDIKGGFVRVRDEGDRVTLTFKVIDGSSISDQKETEVVVGDFNATVSILTNIGCIPRTSEESTRELWEFEGVDITIDGWPFLGTILEIEGKSEELVKVAAEKLGFVWAEARFCAVGLFYVEKYGFGPKDLAEKTGKVTRLAFAEPNPFLQV